MSVKHSNSFRPGPASYSDYERTGNNAIDIVFEAVGWARKVSTKRVAAIKLKPTKFALFVEGMKILMKAKGKKYDPESEFYLDGFLIDKGARGQFETVQFEYVENAINPEIVRNGR